MTAVRAPPIKAGLAMVTVAPGSAAPLSSTTVPVIADVVLLCAQAPPATSAAARARVVIRPPRVERVLRSRVERALRSLLSRSMRLLLGKDPGPATGADARSSGKEPARSDLANTWGESSAASTGRQGPGARRRRRAAVRIRIAR
ncbi:MAG: hypothetical protein AMXMBFR36_32220 [Acidobacteriota bacterium]